MPASGPHGTWIYADIAEAVGLTLGSFRQLLLYKDCPPLTPDIVMGRQHLFQEETALAWIDNYHRWRGEAPARNAAAREAIRATQQAKFDAEMAETRRNQVILQSGQDGINQRIAYLKDRHQLWLDTGGAQGEPYDPKGV